MSTLTENRQASDTSQGADRQPQQLPPYAQQPQVGPQAQQDSSYGQGGQQQMPSYAQQAQQAPPYGQGGQQQTPSYAQQAAYPYGQQPYPYPQPYGQSPANVPPYGYSQPTKQAEPLSNMTVVALAILGFFIPIVSIIGAGVAWGRGQKDRSMLLGAITVVSFIIWIALLSPS